MFVPIYWEKGRWQEELFNTALMHNHNLYVLEEQKNTYNLSGGFANQDGIAAGRI